MYRIFSLGYFLVFLRLYLFPHSWGPDVWSGIVHCKHWFLLVMFPKKEDSCLFPLYIASECLNRGSCSSWYPSFTCAGLGDPEKQLNAGFCSLHDHRNHVPGLVWHRSPINSSSLGEIPCDLNDLADPDFIRICKKSPVAVIPIAYLPALNSLRTALGLW